MPGSNRLPDFPGQGLPPHSPVFFPPTCGTLLAVNSPPATRMEFCRKLRRPGGSSVVPLTPLPWNEDCKFVSIDLRRRGDAAFREGHCLNLIAILGFSLLLLILLAILGQWQHRLEVLRSEAVLDEIREARESGTDKALAQHPQIDFQACIGCGSCIAACPEEGVLGLVDGVAHVIHGSRCIGHARCADVCPVAAVTVGLGHLAFRPDLPRLSENLETSVPGIYIAGELGGFALIRLAVEQGTKVMREVATDLKARSEPTPSDCFDVLIVGAGPAGIAATLQAKAAGLRSLTIDQSDIGGTVRKYPRRKLTITGRVDLPLHGQVKREEFEKEELIAFWEELIATHRLRIETGAKLLKVARQEGDIFAARTSKGLARARRIVLALGRRGTPRTLGVPGEEHEKVLYHLVDASSYNDQKILVVGGGDSAIEAATALAEQRGNQVTLSYRKERFVRLKARNAERIEQYREVGRVEVVFESEVQEIGETQVSLRQAESSEPRLIENDYVFVCAGGEPPYELLRAMGVQLGAGDSEGGDESSGPPELASVVSAGPV